MRGRASSGDGLISRRRLLYLAGASAVGLSVGGVLSSRRPRDAGSHPDLPVDQVDPGVTPTPTEGQAEVVQAGAAILRWSDPKTWGTGRVPGPSDVPIVDRRIMLDIDASVAGVQIDPSGSLVFDPNASRTLISRRNVIVRGTLTMRPARSNVVHLLRITGSSERAFRGGGTSVLDSDVGLWIVDGGVLDAAGTSKRAWTRAASSVARGATSIGLAAAPTGWRVGDEVVITPTLAPTSSNHHATHDVATIRSISGRTIRLSAPTRYVHPMATVSSGRRFGAEVLNLTRNVRIEGVPGHRTHVFIHGEKRQTIRSVAIRHVGPRRGAGADGVVGRYGLHFHVHGSATRGSLVERVVVRDAGNHAFVPHASDGITFRECIAHDVMDEAYWWDPGVGNGSRGVVYDRCVASRVHADPDHRATRLAGFWLGHGSDNRAVGCVSAGVSGGGHSSGFVWPESPAQGRTTVDERGVWGFRDCVAHNNKSNGIFVWQNNNGPTLVEDFVAYHNGSAGIEHGAYKNVYRYHDSVLYGNGKAAVVLHAVAGSGAPSLELRDVICDGAGRTDHLVLFDRHPLPAARPTMIRECTFRGHKRSALGLLSTSGGRAPDVVDVVDCTFAGNELWLANGIQVATLIRVQDAANGTLAVRRSDQAGTYRADWNARVTAIPRFA